MTERPEKQQLLTLLPRAESLAKLRALHNKAVPVAAPESGPAVVAAVKNRLEIGQKMPDGSIFAGVSPDTGKQMFAMPVDAGMLMTFNEAARYPKKLNSAKTLSHDDWRVPTKAELNVLFENREKGALKGTFNLTGSDPSGCYWSGTLYNDGLAYGQRFSDGYQPLDLRYSGGSSVRCVR